MSIYLAVVATATLTHVTFDAVIAVKRFPLRSRVTLESPARLSSQITERSLVDRPATFPAKISIETKTKGRRELDSHWVTFTPVSFDR